MMKFVIYRLVDSKRKTLVEWDSERIKEEFKKRFGEKGSAAFDEVIEAFKQETTKIP